MAGPRKAASKEGREFGVGALDVPFKEGAQAEALDEHLHGGDVGGLVLGLGILLEKRELLLIQQFLEPVLGGNRCLEMLFILSALDIADLIRLYVSVIQLLQNPHGIHPFLCVTYGKPSLACSERIAS